MSFATNAAADATLCSVIPAPFVGAKVVQVPLETKEHNCSLRSVFDGISALGDPAKGEFESTSDYKARMAKVMDSEVIPGIKLSGSFAIVIPVSSFWLEYNADKQAFKTSLPMNAVLDQVTAFAQSDYDEGQSKSGKLFSFIEVSRDTSHSTYQAETRIGVKFLVKKEVGEVWCVHTLPEVEPTAREIPPPPMLRVSATEAPRVKDKIAVVIVGTGVNPPVTKGFTSKPVTLDNPYEDDTQLHDLWLRPTTAYVIRLDTGAVLATAVYKSGMGMFQNAEQSATKPRRHRLN